MNPTRADLTFWQSCIVTRGAPGWARRIARPKYAPHVHEHLDAAINTRAGMVRPKRTEWGATLSLLRMVRGNQSHAVRAREPDGSPSPRTLAGYMLQSLATRGTGYTERRPYYRRILARMPRDIVAAGISDITGGF